MLIPTINISLPPTLLINGPQASSLLSLPRRRSVLRRQHKTCLGRNGCIRSSILYPSSESPLGFETFGSSGNPVDLVAPMVVLLDHPNRHFSGLKSVWAIAYGCRAARSWICRARSGSSSSGWRTRSGTRQTSALILSTAFSTGSMQATANISGFVFVSSTINEETQVEVGWKYRVETR